MSPRGMSVGGSTQKFHAGAVAPVPGSRRAVGVLRRLLGITLVLLFIFTSTGLYSAYVYVQGATNRLGAVIPVSVGLKDSINSIDAMGAIDSIGVMDAVNAMDGGSFDYEAAELWRARDVERIAALHEDWPLSIGIMLGEIALFEWERRHVRSSAERSMQGYRVLSPAVGGVDQMLSAAIQGRIRVLIRRWGGEDDRMDRLTYEGHPLAPRPEGVAVRPADVVALLDDLALPDAVFKNLHITLLPYVLDDTAGFASKNHIVLGAAPADATIDVFERTAYALLHELGHHIYYTRAHTRDGRAEPWWDKYLTLRTITPRTGSSAPSAGSSAWEWSPEETFAEDFRILFGPAAAHTVPHGTVYGNPADGPDGGFAVRNLIENVLFRFL